jgi:membrane-associated phospholipid phosphatase
MADTVGTAADAEHCDSDPCSAPIGAGPGQSILSAEIETAPKRAAIFETATLLTLAAASLSLFLFVWIAETFSNPRAQAFDLAIRGRLHQHASHLVTQAMIAFSRLGEPGVAIGATLTIGIFLWLRRYGVALWMVISLVGAALLNVSLKLAFHRLRPPAFFGPQPDDFSFPSGHALVSACFYGTLAGLIADRIRPVYGRALIWALCLFVIAGVGLSRIYLGVHYPSDVVAGYLVAAGWVSILIALDRLWMRR